MKKNRIKKFGFIIFCALFVGAKFVSSPVFSAETFQNNLLKADIHKSPSGGIKVTLFTSKPYSEPVVVNKKNEFEYIILMPETANATMAKPSLKFVDDVVYDFEVRTQQYSNQVKGYTKVMIFTKKPVEVSSQVQTLKVADYQVLEGEYKELLAQAPKNKKNLVKKETKQALPAKKQTAPNLRAPANILTKAKTVLKINSVRPSAVPKIAKQVVSKPAIAHTITQTVAPQKIVTQSPVEQKNEINPSVQTSTTVEPTTQEIQEPSERLAPVVEPKSVEVNNAFTVQNIKRIIKNNLYTLLGAFFALFILLLLVAKKINRNQNQQKEMFANHLDEKPETLINYSENITDDMTWKEKFQSYVDVSQAQQEPSQPEVKNTAPQSNPVLDDLFSEGLSNEEPMSFEPETDKQEETYVREEILEELEDDNSFDSLISEEEFDDQEISLDELFGDDEQEETETPFAAAEEKIFQSGFQEPEPQDEFIQAEFAIDDEKGFYLVDFEDATAFVGHIGEEIFILKRFDKKINGAIQARLNEQNGRVASYMTKVGNFRAMVEVTPENMNLLIEL